MQTELNLPLWLIILLGILICISIVAVVYKIFAYRRISIVAKKTDYLIEDLIYKTEYITPTIEALVKISNKIDISQDLDEKNNISLAKYVKENKEKNKKSLKKIKEIIKEVK